MAEIIQDVCPVCEAQRAVEHGFKSEPVPVRGETLAVVIEYYRCTACGEQYDTALSMGNNLATAYAQYREAHGIIAPDEIRALRELYGAGQKAFGVILGFGELTINSYEQGSLPADANANLLRLVTDPADFWHLYTARKGLIGPTQRKRIEAAMNKIVLKKQEPVFACERLPCYGAGTSLEASIFTGFIEPSKERLFALIQAILQYAGHALYKTQLLKLLFYSDFVHFRRNTVSLTGWRYAAITHGPVPNDFQYLLPEGEGSGLFVSEPDEQENGDLYSLPPGFMVDMLHEAFSPEELSTIELVVSKLSAKSAKELVELTHAENAWRQTDHAQCISYEWARDIIAV